MKKMTTKKKKLVSRGVTCGYAGRDKVALFVVGSECLEAVGRQALEER